MAGQTEAALVDTSDQQKTTKPKKTRAKRSTAAKKTGDTSDRKKASTAEKKQSPQNSDLPVMKLSSIDMVDGLSSNSNEPAKTDGQDSEQPQIIQMPPPTPEPMEGTAAAQADGNSNNGGSAPQTDKVDENPVTDPELLELLEQLSMTIDTANSVLDAASNAPSDEPPAHLEQQTTQIPEESVVQNTETPLPQHASNSGPSFDGTGLGHRDGDDLRPLAERFASKPLSDDGEKKKSGRFGLAANAALTGLIFAAGMGWLAYTNPWLLDSGAKTDAPKEVATLPVEDSKNQAQLSGNSNSQIQEAAPAPTAAPAPKTAALAPASESTTAAKKPVLSSLSPPQRDPVPTENKTRVLPSGNAVQSKVRGLVGEKIVLGIDLKGDASGVETSIMIQGVPSNAELSAGKSLGSGNWLLTTTQLNGLTLNTQDNLKPGSYVVEVILVRSDGKVPEARRVAVLVEAAPEPKPVIAPPVTAKRASEPKPAAEPSVVKTKTRVINPGATVRVNPAPVPASPSVTAPVKTVPAPVVNPAPTATPLSPQEVSAILKRGNTLLREGDVAGARLLLGYAANRGSKQAMTTLAKSYDPDHLAKLGVFGVQPDPAKAKHWYDRAAQASPAQ